MRHFLQKWWFVISYNLSRGSGDFFGILMQQIGVIQITGATALIWLYNGAAGVLSYILIGKLFYTLSYNDYQTRLGSRIINGKIVNSLMIPQNPHLEGFAVSIGYRGGLILTNTIGILFILLLFSVFVPGSIILPSTFNQWLFILYLPLAFSLNYVFGVIVGTSAFILKDKLNYDGIVQSYIATTTVLCGSIIPLSKIDWLWPLTYLPTSWLLHHPMQVYLGHYNLIENLIIFLFGIAWLFILYIVANKLFNIGLKYHEATGL